MIINCSMTSSLHKESKFLTHWKNFNRNLQQPHHSSQQFVAFQTQNETSNFPQQIVRPSEKRSPLLINISFRSIDQEKNNNTERFSFLRSSLAPPPPPPPPPFRLFISRACFFLYRRSTRACLPLF